MRLMRRGGARGAGTKGGDESQVSAEWGRSVAARVPGVQPIGNTSSRQAARVAGVVDSIKVVPRSEVTRLEITISDGTGELSGVWFGHHRIGGLDLGQYVVFEGMVGSPAPGKLEILHPTYQLLGLRAG